MNAKQVLTKIMTLLNKDEVNLAYAKLKDGTIVESATFDVGEDLFVVSEDGTKTPAPDGEHELSLKDSEENEVLIKVITKDGKIVERENVELEDTDKKEEEKEISELAEETEEVEPITEDEDSSMEEDTDKPSIEIELKDMVEKLAYRIEEMEKKMEEMGKHKMEEETKEEDDIEDMELPKLDGAPIDTTTKMSEQKEIKFGKKVANTQDRFLSKLYK